MFANAAGKPISLDSLHWRKIRTVLQKAESEWKGWHAFRRGLATLLNSLGVSDSETQKIHAAQKRLDNAEVLRETKRGAV